MQFNYCFDPILNSISRSSCPRGYLLFPGLSEQITAEYWIQATHIILKSMQVLGPRPTWAWTSYLMPLLPEPAPQRNAPILPSEILREGALAKVFQCHVALLQTRGMWKQTELISRLLPKLELLISLPLTETKGKAVLKYWAVLFTWL